MGVGMGMVMSRAAPSGRVRRETGHTHTNTQQEQHTCCMCCGPYRLLYWGGVPCGGKHIIITRRDKNNSTNDHTKNPPPRT